MKSNKYYGLRSFGRYARNHSKGVGFVTISFIIANVLLAVIPVAIGSLIGALANNTDPWLYVWILIACSSLHDIIWHVAELSYAKYILKLSFNYETTIFKNIVQRPYYYFVDKFTGKLSSYTTGIAQEIRSFLSDLFFNYISQVINLVAVVLIVGSFNWQTGAIFLGGFALMLIIGCFTLR